MKRLLPLAGFLVFLSCSPGPAVEAPAAKQPPQKFVWDPGKTLVLLVGTLNWQDSKEFNSFPTKNRRDADLADFFLKSGVPQSRLIYLQDKGATLAAIRTALKQLLQASAPGDTLIVYYCGHGYSSDDEDGEVLFASYDAGIGDVPGWAVRELVSKIEAGFKGSRVMLMADCCQSGALAEEVKGKGKHLSYACLGSSKADESSTGNWTFTESILSAWRGEGPADANEDGVITLGETRDYVRSEMRFAEEQKTKSALTGEWEPGDTLVKARKLLSPREGEHVEVFAENDWWTARIVEERGGKFKVFYYGYEADEAEWVGPKRIRKLRK